MNSRFPKFILHAGCYKTATSTIQTILGSHRSLLEKEYGILYPRTGSRRNTGSANEYSISHHLFYHAVRPDRAKPKSNEKKKALSADLEKEMVTSGANVVVVSTELLSFTSTTTKQRMLNLLCDDWSRIQVVYAVRRPDDFAESMFIQAMKLGRERPSDPRKLYSFSGDVRDWTKLLGTERFHLLYFSKDFFSDYLKKVLSAFSLNLEDSRLNLNIHDNTAMTQIGYLLRRMVFDRLKDLGVEPKRLDRHKISIALDELESELAESSKVRFLEEEERQWYMMRHREQFEDFADLLDVEDRKVLAREFEDNAASLQYRGNVEESLPLSSETLAVICEGFAQGYLKKIMRF